MKDGKEKENHRENSYRNQTCKKDELIVEN